jgi:dihydropteroate synthase
MSTGSRLVYTVPLPNGAALHLAERPLIMGILNVTPDSFADVGRRLTDTARAVDAALQMEADGADIIDVGGESTRPGAEPVSLDEELARVLPVLEALAGRLRIPLSIDTYKADVARAAVAAGAVIVNDVTGCQDPGMARAVADTGAAFVVMHSRGRSRAMYAEAAYRDVVSEVTAELGASLQRASEAGVPADRILVDPGVGFAKHASHSYGVLANLPELAAALHRPLLVGPSRKSFLRDALAGRAARDRDWGTAAAVTAAVLGGAHIVRVHAVAEMIQVVRVAEEIRRHRLNQRPATGHQTPATSH